MAFLTLPTNINNRWMLQNARDINTAIRKFMIKTKLKVEEIPRLQEKVARDLKDWGWVDTGEVLHRHWVDLDYGRKSAACSFELARWNIFNVAFVLPELQAHEGRFWHVTLADRRWRCAPDNLTAASITTVKRKVKASIAKLTAAGFEGLYYAVFEVCAAVDPDGSVWFEPHAHILVAGSDKAELKAAFHVRQTEEDRRLYRAVRVVEVPRDQLGNVLGYLSKRRPQTRSGYIGKDGRKRRRTNRMSDDLRGSWHDMLADMPMRDLFTLGGFDREVHEQFRKAEMTSLLRRIL